MKKNLILNIIIVSYKQVYFTNMFVINFNKLW